MTAQDHLPIKEIRDDVAILTDGSFLVVLETSAVNFDLLSENEQLAIIATFAAMLNSLSFAIQIVIRSKRLDISSYLGSLVVAEQKQANPLLKQMISRYKSFIETIIRENEVLDKQFFIVLSVSSLEVGLDRDIETRFKKAMTILMPRKDHIMRQISRIGLKVTQLTSERLIKIYYELYNENPIESTASAEKVNKEAAAYEQKHAPQPQVNLQPPSPQPLNNPTPTAIAPSMPQPINPAQPVANSQPATASAARSNYATPYVVEELPDEFNSV